MKKIAIIGGGAAGMMAALSAYESGHRPEIFEKNKMLGRKLRITGKGRCNITNSGSVRELIEAFGENGLFLHGIFSRFDNEDLMDLLENMGVPLKVERGGRVFPESDEALDVVKAFEKKLKLYQIPIHFQSPVEGITKEGEGFLIKSMGQTQSFDAVIIATGGLSYPLTGSTGDGYQMARTLGLRVTPLKPALVPLHIEDKDLKLLQGLSLKNVTLTIKDQDHQVIGEEFGEMLFTHFGISGPIVLTLSGGIEKGKKYQGTIDLKPALDMDKLDQRILRDFEKYHNKQFKNGLSELLPKSLIPLIIERSKISEDKAIHQITKEERKRLLQTIKELTFTITGTGDIDEAIITKGGIDLKEINPKTMESKKVKGLYFAGEVLDMDGVTGGFNLQGAFSSGYVAGQINEK